VLNGLSSKLSSKRKAETPMGCHLTQMTRLRDGLIADGGVEALGKWMAVEVEDAHWGFRHRERSEALRSCFTHSSS
jgi:hypothetical protein